MVAKSFTVPIKDLVAGIEMSAFERQEKNRYEVSWRPEFCRQ
jgi:hypothetical protein